MRNSIISSSFLLLIIIGTLLSLQIQCDAIESKAVQQNTPEGQRIKEALKFLEEMGSRDAASALTKAYNEGRIHLGTPPSPSSLVNSVTTERFIIIPENAIQRETTSDKVKNFASVEKLARYLLFESALGRNDRDSWFVLTLSVDKGENYYRWRAWILTLREMGKWTNTLLTTYQATSRENRGELYDIVKKAMVIYDDKVECLKSLISDGCIGTTDLHSYESWKDMLVNLTKELKKVQSEIESGGETDLGNFAWHAFMGWGSLFSDIVKGDTTENRLGMKEWSIKFSIDAEMRMGDMAYSTLPQIPLQKDVIYGFSRTGTMPGKALEMSITNKSDQSFSFSLPAGLVLIPSDERFGRLIVGDATYVGAVPYGTMKQSLFVYALDYGKSDLMETAGQSLNWNPLPDRALTSRLEKLIITAKRLSVNDQYQQSMMEREEFRSEITQRSIWYSITKGTSQEVGRESLRQDMEKRWKTLPVKERPRYEEKSRMVDLMWSYVERTVKETELTVPSARPSEDDSW